MVLPDLETLQPALTPFTRPDRAGRRAFGTTTLFDCVIARRRLLAARSAISHPDWHYGFRLACEPVRFAGVGRLWLTPELTAVPTPIRAFRPAKSSHRDGCCTPCSAFARCHRARRSAWVGQAIRRRSCSVLRSDRPLARRCPPAAAAAARAATPRLPRACVRAVVTSTPLDDRSSDTARHRRQDRRAHRRVPAEERPVQESRRTDERARCGREELSQIEGANHCRRSQGRPRPATAVLVGEGRAAPTPPGCVRWRSCVTSTQAATPWSSSCSSWR